MNYRTSTKFPRETLLSKSGLWFRITLLCIICNITINLYSQIPTTGLIAHYKLNGDASDASSYGNNGILYGATPANDRNESSNNAFSFDGQNDYIFVPKHNSLNPSDGITVAAWVKPTIDFTGTGNDPIVDKPYYNHTSPYYQYHLGISGNYGENPYSFGFNVSINEQYSGVTSRTIKWDLQKWYHVVGTYDGIKIRIFINGVPGDSLLLIGKIDAFDTDLFIAKYGNRDNYTPVIIDDVKIYNRALSYPELTELYNYEKPVNYNFSINIKGKNCINNPINFELSGNTNVDSVRWNFGDNQSSAEKSPVHYYKTPGNYQVTMNAYLNGTSYSSSQSVQISGPPAVNLGNDTTLCPGKSILLDAKNPGSTYLWSDQSMQSTLLVNKAGLYNVNVVNACGSANDSILIHYSLYDIYLPGSLTVCKNRIFTISIEGPEGYKYQWNNFFEGNVFKFFPENYSTVKLEVTDDHKCYETYNIKIGVKDCLEEIVLTYNGQCVENPIQFGSSGLEGADSVRWDFGDNQSSAERMPIHYYRTPGNYQVITKAYLNGTRYSSSQSVHISGPPAVNLGKDTTLCSGNSILLDAGNPGSTYLWSDQSMQSTLLINKAGIYKVKAVNACGSANDSILIQYSDFSNIHVPNDTTVCRNTVFTIRAEGPESFKYQWNNSFEGKEFEFSPQNYSSVKLEVSDTNKCSETFNINVDVKDCLEEIVIPNVFTPNGDGINDFWIIGNIEKYPNATVSVFDRWGEVVYSSVGYQIPWDGFYNGKRLSSGSYYYIIILNTGTEAYTGPVMLYQ